MAVQQNKVSRARKRKRRAHHALEAAHKVRCSKCNSWKLPHTICDVCGYYRGKSLITIDEF